MAQLDVEEVDFRGELHGVSVSHRVRPFSHSCLCQEDGHGSRTSYSSNVREESKLYEYISLGNKYCGCSVQNPLKYRSREENLRSYCGQVPL